MRASTIAFSVAGEPVHTREKASRNTDSSPTSFPDASGPSSASSGPGLLVTGMSWFACGSRPRLASSSQKPIRILRCSRPHALLKPWWEASEGCHVNTLRRSSHRFSTTRNQPSRRNVSRPQTLQGGRFVTGEPMIFLIKPCSHTQLAPLEDGGRFLG